MDFSSCSNIINMVTLILIIVINPSNIAIVLFMWSCQVGQW